MNQSDDPIRVIERIRSSDDFVIVEVMQCCFGLMIGIRREVAMYTLVSQ